MKRIYRLIFSMCLLLAMHGLAHASETQSEARGELLYSTHCNACHTSQVHWREQKLVTDWNSLVAQVRRWQLVSGLSWSEEEVTDVAHYLNATFYEYKNIEQGKTPIHLMKKY